MNWAQKKLYTSMHYYNTILKARQLGFCLDPSSKVLTADLKWKRIDSLAVGEEVISVDEHPPSGRGKSRKMRTATIQGVVEVFRKAYKINFDDGTSVTCTGQHPWLCRRQKVTDTKWMNILGSEGRPQIKVGTKIRKFADMWEDGHSYEDGWYGGMLDGEGSISLPSRSGAAINVSQRGGDVWDRAKTYLESRGYNYRVEIDKREAGSSSKLGSQVIYKAVISRMDEMMRLIGTTRPSRFLGNKFWEGKELAGKRTTDNVWKTVVSIDELEEQKMIDLQTSTGTYIAEGLVSHNTTFIMIYLLDSCLFNDMHSAGVIAHTREAAEDLFRNKIRFAYDALPEWLRKEIPAKADSARVLEFQNGSSIVVGTSLRSGSFQKLHISEYGKTSVREPEKAKEIKTGALNTIHIGQQIFIESTAEGQGGEFFDIIERARILADTGTDLTPIDPKFHFFPWYDHPDYRLSDIDAGNVSISDKDRTYFDNLGVALSAGQKAWYVKKKEQQGESMLREFPSCIDGDQYIYSAYGLVKIKDAIVDGQYIKAKFNKGTKPCYRVTTKSGYNISSTLDHPYKQRDGSFVKLENLSVGSELCLGVYENNNPKNKIEYKINPLVNNSIDITNDFSLFTGIFMGDGSFCDGTISIACDKQDEDVVNVCSNLLKDIVGGEPYTRYIGKNKGCAEVRISRKWISEHFMELGFLRQNSSQNFKRNVCVPEFVKKSSLDNIGKFLTGIFETDGFAQRAGNGIKLFSKYKLFLIDIQMLLLMFGITCRVSSHNKKSGNGEEYIGYELSLRTSEAHKFFKEIGFLSKRKNERIQLNKESHERKHYNLADISMFDEIISIEYIGDKEVYDITTSTHEFSAGGIIVHNCPDEAFQGTMEGAIYHSDMIRLRASNRICRVPYEPSKPVHTFWDLGNRDPAAVWFFQHIGMEYRFIDYWEGSDVGGLPQWVRMIREKPYIYGTHYWPHDGNYKQAGTGKLLKEMGEDLGLRPIQIVQRTKDKQVSIEKVRPILGRAYFDAEKCFTGLRHLENYRREWDERLGIFLASPRHDSASHGCDAMMTFTDGYDERRVEMIDFNSRQAYAEHDYDILGGY